MGSCMSHDPYIIKIGTKHLRHSELRNLATFRDAVFFGGQYVPEYAYVIVVEKGTAMTLQAHEPFRLVDEIRYQGVRYPIKKLYGKQNGLKHRSRNRKWCHG